MKKAILLSLIILSGPQDASSQCIQEGHPLDCNLAFQHDHSNTICFGYAMARAWGKDKMWPYDNTVFAEPGQGVDLNYFGTNGVWYESANPGLVRVNPQSIIVFYNKKDSSGRVAQHASYVDRIAISGGNYSTDYLPAPFMQQAGGQIITQDAAYYSTNLSHIIMHQVPNEGGGFEEKTLTQVINEWKGVGPYFRIFTADIPKNVSVTYNNNFASTGGGGKMYFVSVGAPSGGYEVPPGEEVDLEVTIPSQGFTKYYFCGDKQSVKAYSPQTISGVKYEFNGSWTAWNGPLFGEKQDLTINQTGDVIAHFANSTKNVVKVTIYGDGEYLEGSIKVADSVRSVDSSSTFEYLGSNVSLEAYPYLVSYGVVYQFSQWSTGSTNLTITASANGSYTAYYNFHSVNPPSAFTVTSLPGDVGIKLRWDKMVSPYITLFELWSKTKSTSWGLVTTLPSTATTYHDSRYSISTIGSENNIGLEYILKAKYVKPGVRTVWVQATLFEWVSEPILPPWERAKDQVEVLTQPNDFAAYPNPFNPSVVLRVQLQETAQVNLVLYDIAGRIVKQSITGIFEAGIHDFTWNTQENGPLPSGVYFAKLDLTPLKGGSPQQFLRKLLLSK